jgi:flagellar basal-body rod protein FlgB
MLGDIPLITAIKSRMQYHQTRQKMLAENVANADTPGYRPRDMKPFDMIMAAQRVDQSGGNSPVRTNAAHIGGSGSSSIGSKRANAFETTPSGNAVSLEDEMMRMAQNNSDYQMATTLYGKTLSYMRLALGKRA